MLLYHENYLALKVNNTYRWYWVLGQIFWLNRRRNQYILSKTQGCIRKMNIEYHIENNVMTYRRDRGISNTGGLRES